MNESKSAVARRRNASSWASASRAGRAAAAHRAASARPVQERSSGTDEANAGRQPEADRQELSRYLSGGAATSASAKPRRCCAARPVDQATAALHRLEAVETWAHPLCGTAKPGVGKDLAARTAGSAHGPWRLSNSPALAIALPNAFFGSLGLASCDRQAA